MRSRYVAALSVVTLVGCSSESNEPLGPISSGPSTYTLDLRSVISTEAPGPPQQGVLILSHNAVAVFPLDLSQATRVLLDMGPFTIREIQTTTSTTSCEQPDSPLTTALDKNAATIDRAPVERVTLDMPFNVPQDEFTRVPTELCVGLHTADGWVFKRTAPELGPTSGHTDVSLTPLLTDQIAVLFQSTTAVQQITFTTSAMP
ncbi:MAG TPA: hypothetical protein VK459_09835 [Polyangiaceae bacterium]|jgi:hypothetical protein|nr:hypothetical protein [Polyangiaceae bacterium]